MTTCAVPFAAIAQDDTPIFLGEIVIQSINDGGEGVSAAEAANTAGARVPINPEDLPRALSVVPQAYFDVRGAQTFEETLSYSPGVVTETFGQDNRYDEFTIRGFTGQLQGVYRDGLPLRTLDWASWRTEPNGLESVNVLRGPTSDLYGANEPGGLVNGVSKRPTFDEGGEIGLTLGTDNKAEIALDYTAPLSDALAYRVVGTVNQSSTNFDEVETSRVYLAPSLTWQATSNTSLTIYGQYQDDTVGDTYVIFPEYGSRLQNAYGDVSPDTYTGNPDNNTIESEQNYLGYELEQRLGATTTLVSRLRYSQNDWINNTEFPGVFFNGTYLGLPGTSLAPNAVDTAILLTFDVDQSLDQLSADNAVVLDFQTPAGEGTVTVGIDHYEVDSSTQYGFGYAGELNFLTGATSSLLTGSPLDQYLPSDVDTNIRQTGLYVNGVADIAQDFKLTAGLRYDDVKFSRSGFITGPTGVNLVDISVEDTFLSGNIGLSYAVNDTLNVYGNVARSFNIPPAGQTITGDALDLEETQSFEIGSKFASADGATNINVAVFHIEKQNATFDDPNSFDATVLAQVGKVRSQGIELEAIHDFNTGLSLFGTLAYTDAEVMKDATFGGNKTARTPEWSASLYAQYELPTVDGLSVGFGARYTGSRFADIANTFDIDAVTLYDASLTYEWEGWTAQLTGRNLADNQYVAYCSGSTLAPSALGLVGLDDFSNLCTYGAGREIALTVSREF